MIAIIIIGLLVGLDNLQLASAMGLAGFDPKKKFLLMVSFIFFEVSMPLVGMMIGHQLNDNFEFVAELMGPAVMITLGAYIIFTEFFNKNKTEQRKNVVSNGWMIVLLPLLMSFDNLLAGVGLGSSGYPVVSTSIIVGICAGGMCLLGLVVGTQVRKWVPRNMQMISGFYFIVLAVVLILLD
jgi:putative Mn2+ efflux pump MntP